MRHYAYPTPEQMAQLTERPHMDTSALNQTVACILDDIHRNGDEAVRRYEAQFDHAELTDLKVSQAEIDEAYETLDPALREALVQAHSNIKRFHEAQRHDDVFVTTMPGIECEQRVVPIQSVGLYIPGGSAPLFSTVLMLATPAKIAGCPNIVLCTPPAPDGSINSAILSAAKIAGVTEIYRAGGVQAIGAMAYGTETVPRVDKIFGPGNQYVMAAKQQVSLQGVAIDMPAGPSEVAVIADETSHPEFVAADLLSQAEHGPDSQVVLISTSQDVIDKVICETDRQLSLLPRKEIAMKALSNSISILVHDLDEAMQMSNLYAPEHLILALDNAVEAGRKVRNAGSVFLGHYACESAGDYASGTNHTLPTSGYARSYSGVNLDSYTKKITFQQISAEGVRHLAPIVEIMAHNEQLEAHERAMTCRRVAIEESMNS